MPYVPTFYLFVLGRAGDLPALKSYLYDHTRVVAEADGQRYSFAVLATSDPEVERCLFLAGYQADRLRSGLYGVEQYGSASEAVERFAEYVTSDANRTEGIPA